jgi:signal transduction histidine kinase
VLILILILLGIISITLAIFKRDENSLLLLGLCGSLILMFSGIIIYTAKIGGLNGSQEVFLFLSPKIKNWIQYMVIRLDTLGYLIAVGRYLFPSFLLLIAINYSMIPFIRRYTRWIKLLLIIPVASLIVYYPKVFYTLVRSRFELQKILMTAMLIWIFLYLVIAIVLLIKEYLSITMAYFARQFRYILLSHVSLAVLYGIYCVQDPIQVYQLYGSEYLWVSGISYANPSLSFLGWCILTLATLIFVALGFYNLVGYTQLNFNAEREDIQMQRKFDTASMGASVFIHSIKNQLLSMRVLNKKINQVFLQENPDLEELKKHTDTFSQMNENMLERLDELYQSIKSHYISLKPVKVEKIAEMAILRFHQKYPDFNVKLTLETHADVLADKVHLSEAVYNLLTNAQEAVLAAGRETDCEVELLILQERLYTVIIVRDKGTGISKDLQKKIFEPFYTSKNTNYNWGMGLYYVRKIVKSHLGVLRLESVPGGVTSFYIMLPRFAKQGEGDKEKDKIR